MLYKNTKTGAVIDTPCIVAGGDWISAETEAEQKEADSETETGEGGSKAKEAEFDDEEEAIDLSEMTVADLKGFAEQNGIDLGKAAKKEDIIKIIAESDAVEVE